MWRGHANVLSPDAVTRRAGGRRHYNSIRQLDVLLRRVQVIRLMASGTTSRADIAARLGVHPSTISRDITALLCAQPGTCPQCGRPFTPQWAAGQSVPEW